MKYEEFIAKKKPKVGYSGFDINQEWLNPNLFPYQVEIVKRACKKGRYALFVDTGLGKSIMQMNFAYAVVEYTNKPVLILAPLAVVFQMQKEALKFGFKLNRITEDTKIEKGIYITNYEQLEKIKTQEFIGVVLDESSILKSFTGRTKNALIEKFAQTPYKLACSATPSPNDFMELGNHSEFLNILSRLEMLSRFFINDTFDTGEWRLKKHAQDSFWSWVSEWAECVNSPSDLGYDGSSHILPPLYESIYCVQFDDVKYMQEGVLFSFNEQNATTLAKNKKASLEKRIDKLMDILMQNVYPHLVWVDTNIESDEVFKTIKTKRPHLKIAQIKGSDSPESKAKVLNDFAENRIDVLITKSSIAGMGMNFQNACNMSFLGLNYSYEKYYQAVRRMYRFGQKQAVNVNIILADNEIPIWENLQTKKSQHQEMKKMMTKSICENKTLSKSEVYVPKTLPLPSFLRSENAI
ncbi:helicase-related protein [Helicobacter cappadocius]|uniref:Helicase-related protein n=1 Tax=Helicobacter cappadocius TaxID=3063998 RepID=A0AA90Q254_9HELI|nr:MULTISPECIES: helicase-related protein [unclassified Helicobacter]MDO7252785.1 helicase-related protein [Helicobacter sp. faydin-H75]MDP2538828.1 helicase-related protein [Helicobacter sp. faydin-H76]